MNKTENNLQQAITGEARARLKYTAFAMQAMQEGHPEVAQLFLEAAGAETIHGDQPPAGRRRYYLDAGTSGCSGKWRG